MKILTICPSKYPEKLEVMMDSFLETRSEHTNIIVSHAEKPITEIFNDVFQNNPNYDFYHMTNDDVIYKTPEWDIKLAKKHSISYGNDLLQGENLCTFPMIDGDIVRALGWLQLPTLKHYCGDLVWKFIGKESACLNYCGNVFIKHQWNECSYSEIHDSDMSEFAKWLPGSYKEINKIKEILNESKPVCSSN